jgi:hypothetical protein
MDVIWFDAKLFLPIDLCKKNFCHLVCVAIFLPVLLQEVRCSVLVIGTVS